MRELMQSFHWFATNEALKEIHRVIRPEAAFGMIWNIEDCRLWRLPEEDTG
jgi:hypothetical protein